MQLPPADIHWFATQLTNTASTILDAWRQREQESGTAAAQPSSQELQATLERLVQILEGRHRQGGGEQPSSDLLHSPVLEIERLGDNGLQMLTALFGLASELQLEHLNEQLERLALSLALWVCHRDGALRSLELVVNAVARIANGTLQADELEQIFHVMSEILDASVAAGHESNEVQVTLHNPRDLLLLNRAIVATRALSPELMEIAFTDVAEQLPDAAPGFFKEGMEQVRVQKYPEDVGTVIERFHLSHPAVATLH